MVTIEKPASIKKWLADGSEIAFLDVRESGQFGEGHPFLAIPAPYSRLELDIPALVPRKSTRIVLIDGADGVAQRAANALSHLGYVKISLVEGGVDGWRRAGFKLFKGVNLPSKTFGEVVEQTLNTPHISATDLVARIEKGEELVILDGRPLGEFHKMSIPGAICCPNGELALRYRDLVKNPDTPIIINCAGRTRSIVGAQTLIDLGVPNPVYALQNGTQGWYLQDLPLDRGSSSTYPEKGGRPAADIVARANILAREHDVGHVDGATLRRWIGDEMRSTYVLDVRSPAETAADPIAGARPAPGGQLIQATDQYVGTRGARLVIVDTDGVRAPVVAIWLRRLGHESYLVARIDVPEGEPHASTIRHLQDISPDTFLARRDDFRLFDLRSSASYRQSHVEGAVWSIRPLLSSASSDPVVFVADDPAVVAIAAQDIGAEAFRLTGGPEDWRQAGLRVVATPDSPDDKERIDYLFFVHDRHSGNKAAAREYLAWETGLIAQLDEDELKLFRLPLARRLPANEGQPELTGHQP